MEARCQITRRYGKANGDGIKLAGDEISKAEVASTAKLELVTKDNKSENAEASTSSTAIQRIM